MSMEVELFEPAQAREKGRGYVGVAESGGKISYPHIDSCCALTYLLDDGSLVGGHVPMQWDGNEGLDLKLCGERIRNLMQANLERLGKSNRDVSAIVTVHAGDWKKYQQAWEAAVGSERSLCINTEECASGADVTVSKDQVTVTDCKSHRAKTFQVPKQGAKTETWH